MRPKELDLIEAVDVYCNYYETQGGDDKAKLMSVAKNFTKEEIASTIEFIDDTVYEGDTTIKTTLKKLHTARKK